MPTPATPFGTPHGARHEDTILLIGHGSREPEGNDEIHRFVAQWRAHQPGWNIEVCFIEFAPPSLHDGLLQDLQMSVASTDSIEPLYRAAIQGVIAART